MFTVALIGADGAGKSSLGRRLCDLTPLPLKYVYMGVNIESSALVLPTTRLVLEVKRALGRRPDIAAGPPDPSRVKARPKGLLNKSAAGVKGGLRLINLLAEEWFRQCLVWYYQARGFIVLFDRHFVFDYCARGLASNGAWQPFSRRLHGALLKRFYPRPTLAICLDAPAEVLFARKGEGTLESLESRRQEYLQARHLVRHFVVVDASRDADAVAREVVELISRFHATRTVGTDRPTTSRGSTPTGATSLAEFPNTQHGEQRHHEHPDR